MHCYQAYGLSIKSDIALPELQKGQGNCFSMLTIQRAHVAPLTSRNECGGWSFAASPDLVGFEVDGVGRFRVEKGVRILFHRFEGATDDELRLFLLGSALGAVLMQRGSLVLHGSVVEWQGKAVAFLGESGAGKSTIAVALGKAGFRLLSDDLCVVSSVDGELRVESGYPQNKLWLDSLAELHLKAHRLKRVRGHLEKRALRLEGSQFCEQACGLEKIFALNCSESGELEVDAVSGPTKLAVLLACRYRPQFVDEMGLAASQFKRWVQLAQSVEVAFMSRPAEGFSVEEMVSRVRCDLGLLSQPEFS